MERLQTDALIATVSNVMNFGFSDMIWVTTVTRRVDNNNVMNLIFEMWFG